MKDLSAVAALPLLVSIPWNRTKPLPPKLRFRNSVPGSVDKPRRASPLTSTNIKRSQNFDGYRQSTTALRMPLAGSVQVGNRSIIFPIGQRSLTQCLVWIRPLSTSCNIKRCSSGNAFRELNTVNSLRWNGSGSWNVTSPTNKPTKINFPPAPV